MDLSKRQISLRDKYFQQASYKNKFINQLSTVGVANFLARTFLAPLQRYRIIAQVQKAYPLRPKKFNGFADFIKRAPNEQGLRSLWRGNMINCWVYFHQLFFQTILYDNVNALKKMWLEQSQQMPWLQSFQSNFFIPFLASIFSLSVIYPVDTYRIHTTMGYHKNKEDAHFTKFRYFLSNIDSAKNLYKGFWIGVLASTIQFNFFRNIAQIIPKIDSQDGQIAEILTPEFIGSVLCVGLLHPLDTFRKMIQFNNMYKPAIFTGYRSVFSRVKQNYGFKSLYNGFLVSLTRTGLFVPVFWLFNKNLDLLSISQEQKKQNP